MLALCTHVTFCKVKIEHWHARNKLVFVSDLAVVFESEVECKAGNALGLCPCRNLQVLDNTGVRLMFKAGVFTLGVFTNDGKVNVIMPGGEAWYRLAQNDRSIDVKLLTHCYIP